MAFWLADMSLSRDRANDLQQRTEPLTQLIEELENFSASLEAANVGRAPTKKKALQSLVDAQADAIMRCTPDGRVTYANTAFLKLFMLSPRGGDRADVQVPNFIRSRRCPIRGVGSAARPGRNVFPTTS